ncbi:MAG TPA: SseB family protein [Mycobacteriales bacterium]|nr:SseB family protein [Mycobacteriales bacterium]
MPTEAPNDHSGAEPDPDDPGAELGFRPVNDLEGILIRSVLSGARATLLRALARSTLCVPVLTEKPDHGPFEAAGLGAAAAGEVHLPCVTDSEGRHALVYTSYRQMALAHSLPDDAPWTEVPVGTLFEKWPPDVDAWLNGGGELGFPLDPTDISTVADLAAGLEVDEAYEIGPDDAFSDFPGPAVPDQVDCAVVLALFEVPEVLEVVRIFRRLEEPGGRTWRILLVLVDAGAQGMEIAQTVADAVNDASDECCEVHVADVHDDEVYDAVSHFLQAGVPLWRRQGLQVPDTLEGLDGA